MERTRADALVPGHSHPGVSLWRFHAPVGHGHRRAGLSCLLDRALRAGAIWVNPAYLASSAVFCGPRRLLRMRYRPVLCSMISSSVKYFVTLAMVVLAVGAALLLYARYVDRPWTRDGQIRANIVGIAP